MKITKVQRFMLYCLGKWFEEANKIIKDKSLKVSISKNIFIDLVLKAQMAEKQKRAIYKNLEVLEKQKLVNYENRELELTPKGEKLFEAIKSEIDPFLEVNKKLKEKNPTSYTKKVQTVFR
jgi:hypothetical protein